MQAQGRHTVGNRIYYGNYRGGPCSAHNRKKCLLIFFTVLLLLIGFIITIIGFTLKSFWDESDDWCSFCKEDRLQTEKNTANCRIAGPIILGIGILLLIFTIYYSKKLRESDPNEVVTMAPATTTSTFNPPSTSTTANYHPPTTYPPSGFAPTTYQPPQQYPAPYPHQQNPSAPYPAQQNPSAPYPAQQNPSAPYPQQNPYPPTSDPMMPPPPSYNDATTYNQKS